MEVVVLSGDAPRAADNHLLGRFHLGNIPPAKRGVPQIEVHIRVEGDGLVSLTAKDQATGRAQSISVSEGK